MGERHSERIANLFRKSLEKAARKKAEKRRKAEKKKEKTRLKHYKKLYPKRLAAAIKFQEKARERHKFSDLYINLGNMYYLARKIIQPKKCQNLRLQLASFGISLFEEMISDAIDRNIIILQPGYEMSVEEIPIGVYNRVHVRPKNSQGNACTVTVINMNHGIRKYLSLKKNLGQKLRANVAKDLYFKRRTL